MAKLHEILVTTTSSLDGYNIESYLGTISSHIVTGTGIFSDIGAGFRDLFGERSADMKSNLNLLTSKLLNGLQKKQAR